MAKAASASRRSFRCAIYTRKSSEEGLEQEFNSLHAQREACEAFIASQRHEGWTKLARLYDDGGVSGGTLDRPALQQLLADIRDGKVDIVVCYKVDRLTRSLTDFAKIVEIFDAKGVSFVSVTQQFNTTTSMGRLTLNVLLSFAQFEREVTGERIRDKIAASKKKGMWMGGVPPLGYAARDRKLMLIEDEAETVRHIFRRYAALGSVRLLQQELEARGIVGKTWTSAAGRRWGGKPLGRGALYAMLRNPIYHGEIAHKDRHYPGDHPAIVDLALWDEVQQKLTANAAENAGAVKRKSSALLAGLIYDGNGHRMTPTHAVKHGIRYTYYVSRPLIAGSGAAEDGMRLPAGEIEYPVVEQVRHFLVDAAAIAGALSDLRLSASEQQRLLAVAAGIAEGWAELSRARLRLILAALVRRIEARLDRLDIDLLPSRLTTLDPDIGDLSLSPAEDRTPLRISIPMQLRRAGQGLRLTVDGAAPAPDPKLLKLIARAHSFRAKLLHSNGAQVLDLAKAENLTASFYTRVMRLAWLAPDITEAILAGRHPVGLTADKLLAHSRLPLAWVEQRQLLGILMK